MDITGNVFETVTCCLFGPAGPGGVGSVALQGWILPYVQWISNTFPPWAAIRAYVAGRLIGLDKCPGVQSMGIGEVLQKLAGKSVLFVCGEVVTKACGAKQLYTGIRSGIEGGIHAMNDLWSDYGDDKKWGILLMDARNAFNELNCMALLWHVRHLWPA
eukprot:6966319-Ditylum_brightwellii.AAC.1